LSKVELFEVIRRDHREEGVSIRTLARRHKVHRRTVRQALRSALPPARVVPPRPAPALDPWKAIIRGWLTGDREVPRKQRHTARRVWQRLVEEHAAPVAESTVRGYVSELRAALRSGIAEVAIVACHPPGEGAEVDFGEASIILAGVPTTVHLFHLRLSCSGKGVTLGFLVEDQTAFLEGHVIAFERLGGVPTGCIRYDNLKAGVTRVLEGRDRVEADRFIALRSHYAFDSFFCEPGERGAHEKGGVEGEVGRFRRRHLVPVPKVADMAAFDAFLAAADRADERRHIEGRRETVGQAFAAERPHLRALPDEPFEAALPLRARVDRKARVCVRQRWYSVPARLAGREVAVRLGARWVEASHDGVLVARHARSHVKGSQTLLLDHYLEVLLRKPGALSSSLTLAQARGSGAFTRAHERFWARAKRKLGEAAGTRALIEVLLLHRSLPFIAVHAALDTVERIPSADPTLVAIEARRIADRRGTTALSVDAGERRGWSRPVPVLAGYDALLREGGR
jgi:transposase